MTKQWDISVDGVPHTIVYKSVIGRKIIVDGREFKLKSMNIFATVIDYAINIDGSDIRLVVIGNKAELAVNGSYNGSGEAYQPVSSTPAYTWVIIGLSIVGGYFLGGILGILIGCLFSPIYVKNALRGKIGAVIGFFILCAFLQLLAGFIAGFIYGFTMGFIKAATGYPGSI